MPSQVFPMDLHFEIYENEGDDGQRLAHQGVWQEALAR